MKLNTFYNFYIIYCIKVCTSFLSAQLNTWEPTHQNCCAVRTFQDVLDMLTAVTIKTTVFWNVMSASLIGVFWWFGRRCSSIILKFVVVHRSKADRHVSYNTLHPLYAIILHFLTFFFDVVTEWMRAFADSFNELASACIWGRWPTQGWHLSPVSWRTEVHLGDLLMLGGSENNWGRIMNWWRVVGMFHQTCAGISPFHGPPLPCEEQGIPSKSPHLSVWAFHSIFHH
jgi:hypothetical protein